MRTAARTASHLALALSLLFFGGCAIINAVIGIAIPLAGAKLAYSCIPEGTQVDTPAGPRGIETLQPGDLVIGFEGEPVRILQVHAYAEDPVTSEFLTVYLESGAKIDLCGMHRIAGVRAQDLEPGNSVSGRVLLGITRYRGVERSYDLLTEDAGYRIGGVPVNSMIEEMYRAGRTGLQE